MENNYKILIIILLLVFNSHLNGQDFIITNQSVNAQNHFGWDITGSGNYCAISNPRDSISSYSNGSVHVYKRNGTQWTFTQSLTASDKTVYGMYGYKISMSGDFLAISEIGNGNKGFMSGRVYIYQFINNSWTNTQYLESDSMNPMINFGEALKLTNEFLFVGIPKLDSGTVMIYKNNNGVFQFHQRINSPFNMDFEFGKSIDVSDSLMAIGAPATTNPHMPSGVFLYKKTNNFWYPDTFIRHSLYQNGSCFGSSIALSNNTLVIGAPHSMVVDGNENYYFAGSIYIGSYRNNIWYFDSIPIASYDPGGHDLFGSKVLIKDSTIFVSNPRSDDKNEDEGEISMLTYSFNQWQHDTLYAPVMSTLYFGSNMFVLNNQLFVSHGNEIISKKQSEVYVYNIDDLIDNDISNETKDIFNIELFPNPASQKIWIKSKSNSEMMVKIYSSLGHLVKNEQFKGSISINISDLSEGFYLISIESTDGIYTEKLVIKH